ncbi:MAG: DUF5060 domain-containing protein [Puniceicoccaceae bacterium]
MKHKIHLTLSIFLALGPVFASETWFGDALVPLYRVFETEVQNETPYANKFTDVELQVQYQAPSGRITNFTGFYDGYGEGAGDVTNGDTWKMRFMPDETGKWEYVYRWSDGTAGGSGTFMVSAEGAGKGILKAYHKNPHWLAYNGTEPVWIKSYYETGHGSLGQDFDWIVENVYGKLLEHGYNHLQVNWLLSLCCFGQYYLDGPEPETLDLALYEDGKVTTTMNLDVWRRMEQHLGWLNDHDIGVHMFLGFDGSRNEGPEWLSLTPEEQDFYVRYVVARLAPYANIAGWNYVWEVDGGREDQELGLARLLAEYDIFDHLRTYEDEYPRENYYHLPAYNFAAVENHGIMAPDKSQERHMWRSPWTHHMASLLSYKGKPVFMSEGNSLWRRYWHDKARANQDDLRRAAWATVTAGASFTWNGHAKEYELYAGGETGLPFNEENEYTLSETCVQIIADTMNNEVEFHKLRPDDRLLDRHEVLRVYAMAESGRQYLVFSIEAEPFSLSIEPGSYATVKWINAKTGDTVELPSLDVSGEGESVPFTCPDSDSDWVLIVRGS